MASVPAKPGLLTASSITDTSVRLRGTDPSNGGSPITVRQVLGERFGSTAAPTVHNFDLDYTWEGLQTNLPYDFWWRVANAIGWGPYSARVRVNTAGIPDAPVAPTISDIQQTSFRASFPDPPDGGGGISDRKIGYSTVDGQLPTTILGYHGALFDLYGGLLPGRTYYVRARVGNVYGDSGWSPQTVVTLIAGAWVKSGGVWKRAVPYVRVSGVWKLVRPQGRILGIWEETG